MQRTPNVERAILTLSPIEAVFVTLELAGIPATDKIMGRQLRSLAKARDALEQLDPVERANPDFAHMHQYL
jgi:hypothetical protein